MTARNEIQRTSRVFCLSGGRDSTNLMEIVIRRSKLTVPMYEKLRDAAIVVLGVVLYAAGVAEGETIAVGGLVAIWLFRALAPYG